MRINNALFFSLYFIVHLNSYAQLKNIRNLDEPLLVVDSISLVEPAGRIFHKISEHQIRPGRPVNIWIRLKGTQNEAIDLLNSTDRRPVQIKWFRNQNYGFVPERNFEKVQTFPNDVKSPEDQLKKEGHFYFEIVCSNLLKRPGLYMVRIVFNDNQPVLQKNKPCEFKFDIKYE